MNTAAVQTFMSEAHQCAMAMLNSGTYIKRELPNVRMDDATRTTADELCSQLVGTKHDIIHELYELDDLLRDGADYDAVGSKIDLIMQWISSDISQMHRLITSLAAAKERDRECGGAYILVAESAVNILNPFNRAADAVDLLTKPEGLPPKPGAEQGAQGKAAWTSPLAWHPGGSIVCHIPADHVPRVGLPGHARPICLDGSPAYHVTLISRHALEPIDAWMAQVWPQVTGSVLGSPWPSLGSTLFRAEEPSKGRVSWYLEILNPRVWMAYTGTVTLAIDARLRAMGRVGFVNTDADRLFHVSIANLTGDPMHSVGIDAASRSSVILTPETPTNPTPERNP